MYYSRGNAHTVSDGNNNFQWNVPKMKLKIWYNIVVILALFFAIILFPQLPLNDLTFYLRLILIFILITEIILVFRTFVLNDKSSDWIKNIGISIVSTIVFLLLIESSFMFVPRTHGIGYSLANILWFKKYWNPINSHGCRDVEPIKSGKKNIFFVGDSFTAAQGINDVKDRFSDIVKENITKADDKIQVINLAHNSFDTKSEYESMQKFIQLSEIQPDFIVLQYYGNDIDHIAREHGLKGGEGFSPYAQMNFMTLQVVSGSYLINFLYWLFPKQDVNGYLTYLEKAYAKDEIFNDHMREFLPFIEVAKARNIPLLVVIFPFMQEIELSKKLYIHKISNYLTNNEVKYIDLSLLFKDLPVSDRVINSNDAHPSEKVHRLVGDELSKYISSQLTNRENER